MNKLLCIDTPKVTELVDCDPIVIVGQIYHLNEDVYGDGSFYELIEHLGYCYASRCFAPCSDIDETELIRERKTELV